MTASMFMEWTVALFLAMLELVILIGIIAGTLGGIGGINLSKLISENDGSGSMSRFQLMIFTFVIAGVFAYFAFRSGSWPTMTPDVLGLLGISGGSYLVSKGIGGKGSGPTPPPAGGAPPTGRWVR